MYNTRKNKNLSFLMFYVCFCNTTRTAYEEEEKMRTQSDTNDAQNLL